MPRWDGFEVLEVIEEDPKLRSIPVIVFAAKLTREQVDRVYELRANVFVRKPQTLDEYFEVLQRTGEFWLTWASLPGFGKAV